MSIGQLKEGCACLVGYWCMGKAGCDCEGSLICLLSEALSRKGEFEQIGIHILGHIHISNCCEYRD